MGVRPPPSTRGKFMQLASLQALLWLATVVAWLAPPSDANELSSRLGQANRSVCGAPPPQESIEDFPERPRVMLVGDSVSSGYDRDGGLLGYALPVRSSVAELALVWHNGGMETECCNSLDELISCVPQFTGNVTFDVIHVNWGLQSVERRPGGCRPPRYCGYEERIDRLLGTLSEHLTPQGVIVWATTVPVGFGGSSGIYDVDVVNINAISERVTADKPRVVVHDLYREMADECGGDYPASGGTCYLQEPGGYKLTEAGRIFAGLMVANQVVRRLPPPREFSMGDASARSGGGGGSPAGSTGENGGDGSANEAVTKSLNALQPERQQDEAVSHGEQSSEESSPALTIERVQKLRALLDAGIMDQDEFEQRKNELVVAMLRSTRVHLTSIQPTDAPVQTALSSEERVEQPIQPPAPRQLPQQSQHGENPPVEDKPSPLVEKSAAVVTTTSADSDVTSSTVPSEQAKDVTPPEDTTPSCKEGFACKTKSKWTCLERCGCRWDERVPDGKKNGCSLWTPAPMPVDADMNAVEGQDDGERWTAGAVQRRQQNAQPGFPDVHVQEPQDKVYAAMNREPSTPWESRPVLISEVATR